MLIDIGLISLTLAFVLAVTAAIAGGVGGKTENWRLVESARNAALITFPLLSISVLILVYALTTLDFSLAYVSQVSSREMSTFLRVTALWGGQDGSIMFWAWLMAGLIAMVMMRKWDRDRDLMPYFLLVAMGTTAFFIGLSLFVSNPFARVWHEPGAAELTTTVLRPAGVMAYITENGQGLNPLLRHFGMIGHPPTTYLGFTGFVIPYAFAMAALMKGRAGDDAWIRTSRRWSLFAWFFLTIGLVLGGRWAYDVLGWGGFWGWDPIENAMLLPWLTGTAFLHSVMIHEKRGMLKIWNIVLIILTYSLVLFGTFITRTGVVSSVHAFAQSALGPAFLTFIGITFLASVSLLFRRLNTLRTENQLSSLFSRESAFLLQNVLFLAITFAVFWGTIFPMISELLTGTTITVGPPFFKRVTTPLFAGIVLLMALAPLFAWRRQSGRRLIKAIAWPLVASLILSSAWAYTHREHPASFFSLWLIVFVVLSILREFWKGAQARMASQGENPITAVLRLMNRSRRRYGGYLIHLGVVMIALGFIGDSFFKSETQGTLGIGESLELGRYTLRFDNLVQFAGSDGRDVVEASVALFKDGDFIKELRPRRDFFVVQRQPVTVPGVYSTLGEDVYLLLVGWEEIGLSASTFKLYINPLINWTWLGGLVLALGTTIAIWPQGRMQTEASYVLRPKKLRPASQAGD
ncbi:MAG: heme lyase CcmF/NrfE family subunit [Anaerolineales bacterium]